MDTYLQVASVVLSGMLALERGAKHCGVLSRVKHCNFSCSKCIEVDMTRNPSSSGNHAPSQRERFYEAPAVVEMPKRAGAVGEVGAGEVGGSGESLVNKGG